LPFFLFVEDLDMLVECVIDLPLSPFDSERDVSTWFYSNIYDYAEGLLANANSQQMTRLGIVFTSQTDSWVQYYDFSEKCLNCSKKQDIIDWGVAIPTITYTFGSNFFAGDFDLSGWDFDFQHPESSGFSIYGIAKRDGQWHGNKIEWNND
jgi:hypothetical protein